MRCIIKAVNTTGIRENDKCGDRGDRGESLRAPSLDVSKAFILLSYQNGKRGFNTKEHNLGLLRWHLA